MNDTPFMHHYKGRLVVMVDRMPQPELLFRCGGDTEVSLIHIDLTSFHAVIGGGKIISISDHRVTLTYLQSRRWELFEMVPMVEKRFAGRRCRHQAAGDCNDAMHHDRGGRRLRFEGSGGFRA